MERWATKSALIITICAYLEIHRAVRGEGAAHGVSRDVQLDVWGVILAEQPINHRLADGSVDLWPYSLSGSI